MKGSLIISGLVLMVTALVAQKIASQPHPHQTAGKDVRFVHVQADLSPILLPASIDSFANPLLGHETAGVDHPLMLLSAVSDDVPATAAGYLVDRQFLEAYFEVHPNSQVHNVETQFRSVCGFGETLKIPADSTLRTITVHVHSDSRENLPFKLLETQFPRSSGLLGTNVESSIMTVPYRTSAAN